MKLLIMCCLTTALWAAEPQEAKQQDQAKASKAEPAEKPLTEIPAGAVQFEPGSYRYTDAKGKKWILRPTPFGISRIEETADAPPKVDHSLDDAKVTENGDSVKFERPGPFGVYRWEKKKTDLDAGEKAAWEREKAKANAKTDAAAKTTKQD